MENQLLYDRFIISNGLFATVDEKKVTMWGNPKYSTACNVSNTSWKQLVASYPFYRLYYITKGHATLLLRSGRHLELEEGNIYLIPAFTVKSATDFHVFEHYSIHFKAEDMEKNSLEEFTISEHISANAADKELFEEIIALFRAPSPLHAAAMESLLKYILSRFIDETQTKKRPQMFSNIINYINDHITEQLSIPHLASLVHLTPNYFTAIFKKTYGMPPVKYITQKKMELAQIFLFEGKMNITQISDYLGYDSPLYFSALFKKYLGLSPLQYRQHYRDGKLTL